MPDPFSLRACGIVSIHSPTSDYSDPNVIKVSGVVMKGEGIRDRFLQRLEEIIKETFEKHGPNAFKMPKEAAAAHESGHIVVGHSLGYRIKNARLIEHPSQRDVWGGVTHHEQEPTGTSIADRETALRHARMIYAGVVAEAFLTEGQRQGSSLDEVMMSQMIVDGFIRGDEDAATCWNREVHDDVVERMRHNREPFCQIFPILFAKSRIGGPRLQKILSAVQIDP